MECSRRRSKAAKDCVLFILPHLFLFPTLNPAKKLKGAMGKLGIDAVDVSGKRVLMRSVWGDLGTVIPEIRSVPQRRL